MMNKSNIIALVFTNDPKQVVIWDDHEEENRTEISFSSDVMAIKLRKDMYEIRIPYIDRLIVVLIDKVFVFSFEGLKCIC